MSEDRISHGCLIDNNTAFTFGKDTYVSSINSSSTANRAQLLVLLLICRASNSLSSSSAVDLCICSMLNPRVINYQPVPPFTHPKRTELIELLRLPLTFLFPSVFAFFNLLLERRIPWEGRGHWPCLSWQLSLSVLSNHKIKCCHLAEIHKESSTNIPEESKGVCDHFLCPAKCQNMF